MATSSYINHPLDSEQTNLHIENFTADQEREMQRKEGDKKRLYSKEGRTQERRMK
jgi:hypothetical protein